MVLVIKLRIFLQKSDITGLVLSQFKTIHHLFNWLGVND